MKSKNTYKQFTKKQRKNGLVFRKTGGKKQKLGKVSRKQINRSMKKNMNNMNTKNIKKTNKIRTNRFFSGGSYASPPYERTNYFMDPQREIVDSRLLPSIQSGGNKRNQKGGFYGIDVIKTISSVYPYSMSNVTGMTELPTTSRILNNLPVINDQNNIPLRNYLV
jgi:hypothetical protein